MYEAKIFKLRSFEGFSEKQISEHLKLYAGYVKNLNHLMNRVDALQKDIETHRYELAEVKRRLGFEYNGMRLHEYYFEQFEELEGTNSALRSKLEERFGSYDAWKADFVATAKMRGVGWALLTEDDRTGKLYNVWVSDHELGQLVGAKILLACDIWEHAFLLDYLPGERGKYIDVFFDNLNWQVIESRFAQ